ncbi:MAG: alpha/beta fold hydrolase [Pseudomonadota bacterium]
MTDSQDLVLLPGLLCTQALWQHQTRELTDQVRCHIPDLTLDDSIAAMAARVLAEAPPRFALAGLSMGGYVALEIVFIAPERVERLALFDTRASLDSRIERVRRRGLLDLAQKGKFKGVTPRLLPQLIHQSRLVEEAVAGEVLRMADGVGKKAFIRQQTAILGRRDQVPHLSAITCPTLILCGREDVLTPPLFHEEMADLIPRSELHVLEDCGHLSSLECPDAVTALMQAWLKRT